MDWQKRADSIIARVMGTEQFRHRQHENQSVLFESYICKTAAIWLSRGSSVSKHSHGVRNEIVNPVKGKPGGQTRKGNVDIVLEKCSNLSTGNGKLVLGSVMSPRNHCMGCTHNMRMSGQLRGRSKLADVSEPAYTGDNEQDICTRAKGGCSWSEQVLTKMLVLADKKSMLTLFSDLIYLLNHPKSEEIHNVINFKKFPRTIGGRICTKYQTYPSANATGLSNSKVSKYIQGIQGGVDAGSEMEHLTISNVAPYDHLEALLAAEGGHSSHRYEDFDREYMVIQVSQSELSEDESNFSNSSKNFTPEFLEDKKRTCQHSPDSVLKCVQSLSPSQCFDSIDAYSKGSVMGVSGDSDSEEQFSDLSHDSIKIERWICDDDECRNFSYLVDVLAEAGFYGASSCMDFKTWYSFECPINPLVFEILEKQYSKQTSWQKFDQKLLFDGINSGLIHIFNPVTNFHSSTHSNVRANLKSDEVEDELWRMLNKQENDRTKDLSENGVEKWFATEEGMNLLCRELEINLFDELVIELASLWD